jgi:signal transduction histidine kinase/phage shock protein PspC (stress-responsive transcriptional regulator)
MTVMARLDIERLDIERSTQNRLVGGVCAGVANRVGIHVGVVRFAALALCAAGGIGVVVYLAGWALLPAAEDSAGEGAPAAPRSRRRPDRVEDGAAVVGVLGMLLVLRGLGVWWSDEVAIVGVVAAAGIALAAGSSDAERAGSERSAAVRIAVGLVLIALGVIAFGVMTGDVTAMFGSFFGAALAAGGLALIAAPWLRSLSRDLAAERRARMRSQQRAEIAAHLHDGVLQTLTLIQRRANDPREVTTLARRQERQLRDWLQGVESAPESTIAAAFRRASDDVEDRYGVRIELVCVGDGLRDDRAAALIGAATEAMTNAARHGGVDVIDVYVEVTASTLSAFVRDRGRGFDTDAVPDDRHGIVNSIMGRMQRVGGTARIRSSVGGGTEVALEVSR